MHEDIVVGAFTRQAESFNRSAVANADDLLDHIIELVRPRADHRWLEAACGPAVVSRRLAPLVAEVNGVDATPAMVAVAQREAARLNLSNVHFEVGDATSLALPDRSYNGVVARFALHHIPVPARLFEEAARVVVPLGRVVMVDHLADTDVDGFAWAQEVERLRDPSHWASLPRQRLCELGSAAGLTLESERITPMALDFADWLNRGGGDASSAELVRRLVDERSGGTECFQLTEMRGRLTLVLRIWTSAWTKR